MPLVTAGFSWRAEVRSDATNGRRRAPKPKALGTFPPTGGIGGVIQTREDVSKANSVARFA